MLIILEARSINVCKEEEYEGLHRRNKDMLLVDGIIACVTFNLTTHVSYNAIFTIQLSSDNFPVKGHYNFLLPVGLTLFVKAYR